MGATGRVSVVIPLYNHGRYIRRAVESALEQGPLLRELIVIDDGSTDDGPSVMRDLQVSSNRIAFSIQANQGAHVAINAGIARASGEFVSILNSDDAYRPDRLAALVAALDLDAGSDMAASSIDFIDGDDRPLTNAWHTEALDHYKSTGDLGLSALRANFLMTTSNFLFRRRLVDNLGGFAPLRYAHDLDFLLRFAACGGRLAFIDRPLLRYRFHDSNTIKEDHTRVRMDWAMAAAGFLAELGKGADTSPPAWPGIGAALCILEDHSLLRGVQLCLLYLRRLPQGSLPGLLWTSDTEFSRTLQASVS